MVSRERINIIEKMHDNLEGKLQTCVAANELTTWTYVVTHFGFVDTYILEIFISLYDKSYTWDNQDSVDKWFTQVQYTSLQQL